MQDPQSCLQYFPNQTTKKLQFYYKPVSIAQMLP